MYLYLNIYLQVNPAKTQIDAFFSFLAQVTTVLSDHIPSKTNGVPCIASLLGLTVRP
jgi:hypothetical protein